MEQVTEQKRIDAYRASDEAIKALYGNEDLGEKLGQLYVRYAPESDRKIFIDTIGDTILGFYTTIELPNILQKNAGVGADDAQRIVSELSEFLAPVVAREKAEGIDEETAAQTIKPAPGEGESEEEIEKVPPIHTMQGDAKRIHGYGALYSEESTETDEAPTVRALSQEDTLTRTPKIPIIDNTKNTPEENN